MYKENTAAECCDELEELKVDLDALFRLSDKLIKALRVKFLRWSSLKGWQLMLAMLWTHCLQRYSAVLADGANSSLPSLKWIAHEFLLKKLEHAIEYDQVAETASLRSSFSPSIHTMSTYNHSQERSKKPVFAEATCRGLPADSQHLHLSFSQQLCVGNKPSAWML